MSTIAQSRLYKAPLLGFTLTLLASLSYIHLVDSAWQSQQALHILASVLVSTLVGAIIYLLGKGPQNQRQTLPLNSKVAEQQHNALEVAKSHLEYLLTSTPAVIYTCKVRGDCPATFVSDRVTSLLGYTPQMFTEDPSFWADRIHPGDRDRIFQELATLMTKGYHTSEYRFKHRDGHYCWMHDEVKLIRDEQGQPVEAIGSWLDISERKRSQQALLKSEALFRGIADTAQDAVILIDGQGSVNYWNRSAERIFGYHADEVMGRSLHELVATKADQAHCKAALAKFTKTGQGEVVGKLVEVPAVRKGGETFPAELSISPLKSGDGWQAIGIVRDISHRKAAEEKILAINAQQEELIEQLTQAQGQLIQSEKLAAIGQLAAGVAHEINNPVGFVGANVNAMHNYLEDLLQLVDGYDHCLDQLGVDDETRNTLTQLRQRCDLEYLKEDSASLAAETKEGVERIKKIVADLKDFSRASSNEWEHVDLHHEIETTLNVVHNQMKYHCTVTKAFGDLPEIQCLRSELNQVIMNLLVNASQAIETQGEVRIETLALGDQVQILISDTGQGIPPEVLSKIFDPFFTTKPVGQGTGLGLSVSYGIIEKHRGTIEVESKVGKGTTFKITLPIEQPQEAA